ncbi:hypothetical protein PV327_009810 [Microctonus hyperodae]|uniref:MATH domain-containing protein n=1 Tax=Microctonus hyperodae TaxID=165561 RepID=A0AA39F1R1_MICHY|nr:hypothetical protein PV327_009810 [Microctonus hyperodae]
MTTESFECRWTIQKFNENFEMRSTNFTIETIDKQNSISWDFVLYPVNSDCVMFQIVNENENYLIKSRRSHLYIVNTHGKLKKINSVLLNEYDNSTTEKGWTSYCFSKKFLLHNAELFLPNDELSIICEVDIKEKKTLY